MLTAIDLVLPPACAGCGDRGAILCGTCIGSFRPPGSARDRFVAPDPAVVIGGQLAVAIAAFGYAGRLRRLMHRLKYTGISRVAEPLAVCAAPVLHRLLSVSGPATLVPVPVSEARRRRRGYNQAALIARALARRSGAALAEPLARSRETQAQHRLDRAARARNLRGAFTVDARRAVPNEVILIDDILTTGATLDACAEVLLAAGARTVYGFAIAREV
jgi:ComF family protein